MINIGSFLLLVYGGFCAFKAYGGAGGGLFIGIVVLLHILINLDKKAKEAQLLAVLEKTLNRDRTGGA